MIKQFYHGIYFVSNFSCSLDDAHTIRTQQKVIVILLKAYILHHFTSATAAILPMEHLMGFSNYQYGHCSSLNGVTYYFQN